MREIVQRVSIGVAWYEGNFVAGKAHGQGRLDGKNGNVYDGFWQLGRAHGFGKYSRGSMQ